MSGLNYNAKKYDQINDRNWFNHSCNSERLFNRQSAFVNITLRLSVTFMFSLTVSQLSFLLEDPVNKFLRSVLGFLLHNENRLFLSCRSSSSVSPMMLTAPFSDAVWSVRTACRCAVYVDR